MEFLVRVVAITLFGLRSLPQRWGSSLVIVAGIAGVVAILLGMLAMSGSLVRTMNDASRPDRAIVLSKDARSEAASSLDRQQTAAIKNAAGLKMGANGQVLASPETLTVLRARQKDDNIRGELILRGITPPGMAMRSEIRLAAGRMFSEGTSELIVGRAAAEEFVGLQIGSTLQVRGSPWAVVGIFESDAKVRESEVLGDADALLSAYQRNTFSAITVQLASTATFGEFRDALSRDPTLSVDVLREADYLRRQTDRLNELLSLIAYVVGGIMAVGAIVAAINCMHFAVSSRSVEIAILRALGFEPAIVSIAVLAEALLLALAGAALGTLVAWAVLSGNSFSTQIAGGTLIAKLQVSSDLMVVGALSACAIGMIGGLFPALRAVRTPIATALREF